VWDYGTPIEETLRALTDLVKDGKVRYIGASNFNGWQVQKASDVSKYLNLERFCCLQNQYSLLSRENEWEVNEVCRLEGVGMLPWSPLKGKRSHLRLAKGQFALANRCRVPRECVYSGMTHQSLMY